ncbi:MAG: GntR family transcriptional regulator [Sedimentisphaerales bacterium]
MLDNSTETPAIMTLSSMAAEKLRKDIHSGHYKIGQRLANEHKLASNFGVNRGTIRKALKILEEERLIARRHGHGTFVTNPTYAQTTGTAVSLIGAMVWENENYIGAILNGAFSRSASRGYMLTTASNSSGNVESYNSDAFIKSGIRGIILTPRRHSVNTYKRLVEANIPVVMLDTILSGTKEDFVSVNNLQGIEMATEHLIELGHTKIGYVGSNDKNDIPCTPSRLEGFLGTCARHNIETPDTWRIEVGETYLPQFHSLLSQPNRPTAIVAHCDIWAVRIIQVARELGLKVPQDLSVTGFDDSEVSRTNSIPLTTVSPEPDEIGTTIIDLLIEKIENPRPRPKRSILITPRLVVRESTAKP